MDLGEARRALLGRVLAAAVAIAPAGACSDPPALAAAMPGAASEPAAAAAGAPALAGPGTEPAGHLVVIGGGDPPRYLMRRAVLLAGGRAARFLVVPMASAEPAESAAAWAADLAAAGAGEVDTLIVDRAGADEVGAARRVAAASGVFFSGGDQSRLTGPLLGSRLLEEIRALYRRGGVVAGSSAGAAVMGPLMFTGNELPAADPDRPFPAVRAGYVEVREAFDLWPGVLVDQHFLARRRHNRLLSAVLERPELLGVGIDEATAAIVGAGQRMEVLGESLVMVVDAGQAGPITTDRHGNLAADGLRVHLLRSGQGFDLAARAVIP